MPSGEPRQFAQVRMAGRLIAVKQRAAIRVRAIGQRAMHQERAEERDAAGRHLEWNQARLIILKRVHFEAAKSIDRAARLYALAMTTGHHLETSVFDCRIVEKEH